MKMENKNIVNKVLREIITLRVIRMIDSLLEKMIMKMKMMILRFVKKIIRI